MAILRSISASSVVWESSITVGVLAHDFTLVDYIMYVFSLFVSPLIDQTHELVRDVLVELALWYLIQHLGECATLTLAMLVHL